MIYYSINIYDNIFDYYVFKVYILKIHINIYFQSRTYSARWICQRLHTIRGAGPPTFRVQQLCWSVSCEFFPVRATSIFVSELREGANLSWYCSFSFNSMFTCIQIDENMMYLLCMLTKSYTALFFNSKLQEVCLFLFNFNFSLAC